MINIIPSPPGPLSHGERGNVGAQHAAPLPGHPHAPGPDRSGHLPFKYFLATAFLALLWALLLYRPLGAAEPQIVVSSNAPAPLAIDGEEVQALPAVVKPGSEVCVLKPLYYVGEGERFRFSRWKYQTQGSAPAYSAGPCLTLNTPAKYSVVYDHEVLLQVRSKVKAYQRSLWVPQGEVSEISVPEVVKEGDGVQFRFEEWSGGETPFKPANSIAPLRPSVLEVKWSKEYYVQIEEPVGDLTPWPPLPQGEGEPHPPAPSPRGRGETVENSSASGAGWYPEGKVLILRATPEVYEPGGKSRLKFEKWEGLGATPVVVPNMQSHFTSVAVDAPLTVRASYRREYLVVAQNFQGSLKRTWVAEGEEVVLETPAIIETVSGQERYVFKGWEGEGELSPKVNLVVDRAINLQADYERQFMVNVSAPFGASAGGWYAEGSTAKVTVPKNPQSMLFLKKVFTGFPGYITKGPVLEVPVRQPMTITPIYSTRVDWKVLGLLLFVLIIGFLIYLITQRARSSY